MKLIGSMFGAFLLLANHSASATDRWHTAQIRWLYPLADGSFHLVLSVESEYCTSAAIPKYYHVGQGYNGVNAEAEKKLYAAAMMAVATGRQVSILFDDSTSDCAINRMIVRDY